MPYIYYFCKLYVYPTNRVTKLIKKFIPAIKKFFTIVIILVVLAVAIPLTVTLLLSNSKIQNYVVDHATEKISELLGTDVVIGTIAYQIPASIKIDSIYIADLDKDTLAYINSVTARMGVRSALFKNQIAIKDVNLDGLLFHLKTDSTGVTNLQFIIDALSDTTQQNEPLTLIFAAPDVKITNSRFIFDNTSVSPNGDELFDANHIDVMNINTNASLEYATADSLKVTLHSFECQEKSGLQIDDITGIYSMRGNGMSLEAFKLELPNSKLEIPLAEVRYDSIAQFSSADQFLNNAYVVLNVKPSFISGKDMFPFTRTVDNLRNDLSFRTNIEYADGTLDIKQLNATYGKNTSANLKAMVSGIAEAFSDTIDIDQLSFYAEVYNVATNKADIENTISDISKKPFKLPKEISGLSRLQYRGTVVGSPSDAKYVGRLTTNAGVIQTDANGGYSHTSGRAIFNGNLKLRDFDLSKIMDKEMKMGKVSLDVTASGSYYEKENRIAAAASGNIESFEFNDYVYKDIDIDALYNPERAVATVTYNDANGNGSVSLDAFFDNTQEVKTLNVELIVDSLKTGKMNLTPSLPTLALSADLHESTQFTSIDAVEGALHLDNIIVENEGMKFFLDTMYIDAYKIDEENRHIAVRSPILTANVDGQYTPSTVINNISYIVCRELDNIKPLKRDKMKSSNNFKFDMTVMPLDEVSELFNSNKTISDTTYITGSFNDYDDNLSVTMLTNDIKVGEITYDSIQVFLTNYGEKVNLQADAIYQTFLDTTYWGFTAGLYHNNIDVNYNFWNTIESDYSGELKFSTEFFKPKHADATIETLLTIHDSELILNDSTWQIKQGTIFYDEHDLTVKDLAFEGTDQYLRIEGGCKRDIQGTMIKVDMKGVDLQYISNVVYMPDIKLLGIASGKVVVADALNRDPILDADVNVKGFGLNGYPITTDTHATAKFNHENKHIELYAAVLNDKQDTSYVHGYVAPTENYMLLDIDINELHLKFIEQYLQSFSHEMDGVANGKLYVGGPLDKIEIWGDAYVHDAKLGIDFLNTTFNFSDSVHIKKDKFIFKDIHLTDNQGHTGTVDGLVTHKLFQNFKYQIGFSIDDVQVMNTTSTDSPDFYGRILASGDAMIVGDDTKVDITVAAKPEAGSYFAVPLDSYRTATDNQFITFIKKDTIRRETIERGRKRFLEAAPTTKINVDLSVEATPDVEARIIMDSHSGDVIRGRGNGNIKVTIDQNTNVKLYGKYNLTEGDYNFSLQGAIRKKFEVGEGSSITFDGDPMNGVLDIKAKYQTTASLTDLLEEGMLADINNTNVKVNCLAYITGNLLEPKIKFDIELPNADDEILRRVKATINTDDMMLQQIVFLLVFGKFYNNQTGALTTSAAAGSYASSFATSTISSQLNYWMSQISNNVNLGINYNDSQRETYNNYAVAVNVSTNLFNNRLILNGNVGYQRQKNGQENFIGDFDVEYKLTKSGRFRLKAYNKTNDITYSTSLYTQGLGVMFKESFDTWENLGKTYKELTRKKTPEEKAEIQAKKEKEKAEKAKRKEARKALREDRKRRHKEYVANQKIERARLKEEKKAAKEAAKQ